MIPAVSPFLLLKSKCLGHGSPKMHGKILQSVDPEQWLIANDLLNYLQLYLLYSLIATNINIRLHIYIYILLWISKNWIYDPQLYEVHPILSPWYPNSWWNLPWFPTQNNRDPCAWSQSVPSAVESLADKASYSIMNNNNSNVKNSITITTIYNNT